MLKVFLLIPRYSSLDLCTRSFSVIKSPCFLLWNYMHIKFNSPFKGFDTKKSFNFGNTTSINRVKGNLSFELLQFYSVSDIVVLCTKCYENDILNERRFVTWDICLFHFWQSFDMNRKLPYFFVMLRNSSRGTLTNDVTWLLECLVMEGCNKDFQDNFKFIVHLKDVLNSTSLNFFNSVFKLEMWYENIKFLGPVWMSHLSLTFLFLDLPQRHSKYPHQQWHHSPTVLHSLSDFTQRPWICLQEFMQIVL